MKMTGHSMQALTFEMNSNSTLLDSSSTFRRNHHLHHSQHSSSSNTSGSLGFAHLTPIADLGSNEHGVLSTAGADNAICGLHVRLHRHANEPQPSTSLDSDEIIVISNTGSEPLDGDDERTDDDTRQDDLCGRRRRRSSGKKSLFQSNIPMNGNASSNSNATNNLNSGNNHTVSPNISSIVGSQSCLSDSSNDAIAPTISDPLPILGSILGGSNPPSKMRFNKFASTLSSSKCVKSLSANDSIACGRSFVYESEEDESRVGSARSGANRRSVLDSCGQNHDSSNLSTDSAGNSPPLRSSIDHLHLHPHHLHHHRHHSSSSSLLDALKSSDDLEVSCSTIQHPLAENGSVPTTTPATTTNPIVSMLLSSSSLSPSSSYSSSSSASLSEKCGQFKRVEHHSASSTSNNNTSADEKISLLESGSTNIAASAPMSIANTNNVVNNLYHRNQLQSPNISVPLLPSPSASSMTSTMNPSKSAVTTTTTGSGNKSTLVNGSSRYASLHNPHLSAGTSANTIGGRHRSSCCGSDHSGSESTLSHRYANMFLYSRRCSSDASSSCCSVRSDQLAPISSSLTCCSRSSASARVGSLPWLFPNMSREEACDRLGKYACLDGVFLVRTSHRNSGQYVLNVVHGNKVLHILIQQLEFDQSVCYSLDNGKTKFYDIQQLIEFHQLNNGGLPTKLRYFLDI